MDYCDKPIIAIIGIGDFIRKAGQNFSQRCLEVIISITPGATTEAVA
jgi:hypothetical protein